MLPDPKTLGYPFPDYLVTIFFPRPAKATLSRAWPKLSFLAPYYHSVAYDY
ncbi:MAG: hypothetical protein N2112_08305 [Gemmataceae bacterium]|jgi:hypothetical protein|nr:hypothetical protein [Gemmataceae bacterium]